jgi:signal transduction histidine kinase
VPSQKEGREILRILHIEPSESDADRVLAALVRGGIECDAVRVERAADVEAALAQDSFDLILAEYVLPDAPGPSPLEVAGATCPEIPFVFVSSARGEELAAAAVRAGADDYVPKQRLNLLAPAVRRAIEEARQHEAQAAVDSRRQRLQDEFVSRLGHDLRSPLTAIKASIGVVLANEPPGTTEPLHRMFRNIDYSADQMAVLAGNLAELARLQAGRADLRREPNDVSAVVAHAVKVIEPYAQRREQRVAHAAPAEPVVAFVDNVRLERALTNLLINASKFGTVGGTIRVELGKREDMAVIEVADDGPGIPASERERVFDHFFSPIGEPARQERPGLGLLVSRSIVELHGGQIWAAEAPGGGALFGVGVPLTESGASPTTNGHVSRRGRRSKVAP